MQFVGCSSVNTNPLEEGGRAPQQVTTTELENGEGGDTADKASHDGKSIIGSSSIDDAGNHHSRTYFLYGAEQLNLDNYYFDIPVVFNSAVQTWIHYFLNRGRGFFERYSARSGRYAPLMGQILEDHGLPRDLIFLAMAESGFQDKAKSWARAVGPWQFMSYTGKKFGLKIDWYVDERMDPIKSTIAACNYLTVLYKQFGSWELAASAYNAGEGKVNRAIRKYNTENFWSLREGRYLRSETKNYVPKIMALAIIGKNLKAFGFEDIDFHEQLDFDEIDVPPMTDLVALAEQMGVDFEELQRLNPEVMRWFTPPNVSYYKLRVPINSKAKWADVVASGVDLKATNFRRYSVQGQASTLRDIAKKFSVAPYVLEELNGIDAGARIVKGQAIALPFRADHDLKNNMYADLYERPRKEVLARSKYKGLVKLAKAQGKHLNSSNRYTVRRGDTLWDVAKKTNTPLYSLIVSNLEIINNRMIREGDRLIVR
ncbi:MAG: hypothetical protein A2504_03985 [Bdellovibrionales bacterium RIFOXYD12_FULL_39_22]|nr:MAG: hypothetical protein A2485_02045 [Bdellovibrionales bacterium RIFOXYC12_FULL_39_17]OFZ92814.1 MAG: hypothetical protein A2504_03985 [Bdellovibrionales bacterium RIFOXYD12_FULL_39_22]